VVFAAQSDAKTYKCNRTKGPRLLGCAEEAGAAERFALVIGNSDYQYVDNLPNTAKDTVFVIKERRNTGRRE
jgi:hypothetical protein